MKGIRIRNFSKVQPSNKVAQFNLLVDAGRILTTPVAEKVRDWATKARGATPFNDGLGAAIRGVPKGLGVRFRSLWDEGAGAKMRNSQFLTGVAEALETDKAAQIAAVGLPTLGLAGAKLATDAFINKQPKEYEY